MSRPVHAALCALALAGGLIVGSLVSGLAHDYPTRYGILGRRFGRELAEMTD